jgi:lysophospholipase L1-like esterase
MQEVPLYFYPQQLPKKRKPKNDDGDVVESSEEKNGMANDENDGQSSAAEEEEFRSLLGPTPLRSNGHSTSTTLRRQRQQQQQQQQQRFMKPLSITTVQEYDASSTTTVVRLPSVHVISSSSFHRNNRIKSWRCSNFCCPCGGCGGGDDCCCCSFPCCYWWCFVSWWSRFIWFIVVITAVIYVVQQQQEKESTILSSSTSTSATSKTNKHPITTTTYDDYDDDDILFLAGSTSSSSSSNTYSAHIISNDYTSITSIDDIVTRSNKVPVQCLDFMGRSSHREKNNKKLQDCPCSNSFQEMNEQPNKNNTRVVPVPRTLPGWDAMHQTNIQLSSSGINTVDETTDTPQQQAQQQSSSSARTTTRRPNVIFLGDSITERWHGTKNLGRVETQDTKETAQTFSKLFQQSQQPSPSPKEEEEEEEVTSRTIYGVPLGIAGDQTPNLLWRIQNGELPPSYHGEQSRQIFVVLIGTNDLSKDYCSPENVVIGILYIVEWILQRYSSSSKNNNNNNNNKNDDTQILLHGLLPRTNNQDGYLNKGIFRGGAGTGGSSSSSSSWGHYFSDGKGVSNDDDFADEEEGPILWPVIQAINEELESYAMFRDNVEYFETDVFIKNANDVSRTKWQIDLDLMPDGLHPSSRGYELWGRQIQSKLHEMLDQG